MVKTQHHATLVMDSRKTWSAVRNQNLSGSWSQLYKVGEYYLDLSLRSSGNDKTLMGHLVGNISTPALQSAVVHLRTEETSYKSAVAASGMFRLPIEKEGTYNLEVELQDQYIAVDKLEL